MKKTIETMNRHTAETMERKAGETLEKRPRFVRNFRATELSLTSRGLAIGGFADYEPLSANVPSARQENPAVATRKPV
jgi:hypothetical protein